MFDRLGHGIYWDRFWRLVDGCTPASPGCDHCWAAREANMRTYGPKALLNRTSWNGQIAIREDRLTMPLKVKKPKVWFVLNDLYHEQVKASFIVQAYEVMEAARQHIFIVFTKRPERIVPVLYGEEGRFYLGGGDYIPNVWHMTTAENQEMADKRIPELLKLREASPGWPVLGVSIEPMLGMVDLAGDDGGQHFFPFENEEGTITPGIDWVVVGTESGPGRRPAKLEWIAVLVEQCRYAEFPCFVKQLEINGRISKNPMEWPEDLRVREIPK